MKATGNWNTDMSAAPKDGKAILLLTIAGVAITGFWTKFMVQKKSQIALPEGHQPELEEHEGWMATVGPGVVLIDPMVAWAKIKYPKIKFKSSPHGNDGKVIDFHKAKDTIKHGLKPGEELTSGEIQDDEPGDKG